MHGLIEQAKTAVDQAELYWKRAHTISVEYENNRLQEITENDLSSVAVRVIDGGRLGSTSAISPDQDGLIARAKAAAAYGEAATFAFAPKAPFADVDSSSPASERLTSENLLGLCESIRSEITKRRDDLPLFVSARASREEIIIETTQGAEGRHTSTEVTVAFGAPIRGAGMPVYKFAEGIAPLTRPDELIDEFVDWYAWTERTSTPSTGRLPVIFAPSASFLYLVPLWAGLEGNAIEKKTSPLVGRAGEAILSEKMTIIEDPLAAVPGARPFDDEGVPCRRRPLVEKGKLSGYLYDLRTAAALGQASTGNAVKRELFSAGTDTAPNPWPIRLAVKPGATSYREMMAGLEEGLLVYYGLGFHSGNYPRGQFAVQAVGFHIKNGSVAGRLEKTMISGNIYEDFQEVLCLSSKTGQSAGFLNVDTPYVLVDSVQVAGA
jgi:PmbA protein